MNAEWKFCWKIFHADFEEKKKVDRNNILKEQNGFLLKDILKKKKRKIKADKIREEKYARSSQKLRHKTVSHCGTGIAYYYYSYLPVKDDHTEL